MGPGNLKMKVASDGVVGAIAVRATTHAPGSVQRIFVNRVVRWRRREASRYRVASFNATARLWVANGFVVETSPLA
jgi:hypothetical protein